MIVVGCGKTKLEHAAPARELYTGSVFRAARRYAEATGEEWVILSAKHGIVHPTDVLEPYEQTFTGKELALEVWARRAARRVALDLQAKRVECLAGASYAKAFVRELAELGVTSTEPLARFGTGKRIQWLLSEAKRLEPLKCYACDSHRVVGQGDRRPEGGKLEPACARHADPGLREAS